jgi:group I intron endonuclease
LYILEYCNPSDVAEREQYYFNLLNPDYNILKKSSSSIGFKHSSINIDKIKKNHYKSIQLKVTNALTNETKIYNSIIEAAKQLSLIEGISFYAIRDKIRRNILATTRGILLFNKYKFERIIKKIVKEPYVPIDVLKSKVEKSIKAVINHPRTIPIKLTNIVTKNITLFISIREAGRNLSGIEGIAIETAVAQIRSCLKNGSLFRGKYKVERNN